MAEVITSIGSDTSTGTATPSSCGGSGGSGGYTVTFSSAPAGVARGDMVQMTDEATYYATFTYRVASISGSTLTFIFISEDSDFYGEQSPCDLMNMMWEQAECNFSRYYTTIYEWETDLGFTDVYDSGDDAVGECHNDSAFDESNTINGLGSLNSITLTVHPNSRHNGTAGSGARIVRTGTTALTPIVINCNEVTVEWLEIDCADATGVEAALEIDGSALENINVRNMILHDVDPEDDVDNRYGIKVINSTAETVTRVVSNNFIYRILRSDVSPAQERKCRGIGEISTEADDDAGASYYNNTLRTVSTTNGTSYGYHVSDESVLINNIALSCGSACYKVFDDTSGSDSSSYNLSDDLTAADLGRQPPDYDNHAQTSATGVVANYTVMSLTNLHLRLGDATSGISLAVDRGINLGGSDEFRTDIDGYIRVYGIPSAVARGYWDIGAEESEWSHPYPVSATADTYYMPPPLPAIFELAVPNPTVVVARPSISITPIVAALLIAAVSPNINIGYPSVSITPATATLELTAVSPSVSATVSVTPAAASFELAGVSPTAVAGSLSVAPSAAAVEFAGVSPSVQSSSLSISPSASAFELAGISPTIGMGSLSMTPAVSAVEFAGIAPSVLLSTLSITPAVSALELIANDASIVFGSITIVPASSDVEFAADASVVAGSISIPPSVAALEFTSVSPSVTRGSISITPAAAIAEYRARYGSIIFGGIVVIPVPEAQFVYTAVDSSVGLSSVAIAVTKSAFELVGASPSIIRGSISVTPAVSVVEFASSVATIYAGIEVTPAVAAFEYVVGTFTLRVDMDSASLGYACGGLVDYRGSIPCDYKIIGVLDYIAGVLPTDYQLEKNLDYRYDHQS